MASEGADDATEAPVIGLIFNSQTNLGARGDSLLEDRVGIVKDKDMRVVAPPNVSGLFVLGRLVSNFPQRPHDDRDRSTAAARRSAASAHDDT